MRYLDKKSFIKERSSFILSLFNVVDMKELRIIHLITEAYNEGFKDGVGFCAGRDSFGLPALHEIVAEVDAMDEEP
jgi:hypothetical protein